MSTFLFTSESVNEGHPGTFILVNNFIQTFSFRRFSFFLFQSGQGGGPSAV